MTSCIAPILIAVVFVISVLLTPADSTAIKIPKLLATRISTISGRNTRRASIGASVSIPSLSRTSDSPAAVPHAKDHEFLWAHNKVRSGLKQPPLQWDRFLARYARRFASSRVNDCKMVHSDGPHGENIFWAGNSKWTPTQIVDEWVAETKFYDAESNLCQAGAICGHYTQIVWRDTSKLGCARATCKNGGMYAICVYDPPGNYRNESPFVHHERI